MEEIKIEGGYFILVGEGLSQEVVREVVGPRRQEGNHYRRKEHPV